MRTVNDAKAMAKSLRDGLQKNSVSITFHRELSGKHYAYARPGLEEAFWGGLTVEVVDPFGNRLLFAEEQEAR
jgi:hypothetical protein